MDQDDLDYHRERARAELDCAYRSVHQAAADAHMRLASLHMKCVQSGDEDCEGSGLRLAR